MKSLFILIALLLALAHSLPPRMSSLDSERPWIRRVRSDPSNRLSSPKSSSQNGRIVKVFGYAVRIPPFVDSTFASVKNFLVGPSGVITRIRNFLKGDTKVSMKFFGRQVDFQANVPLSTEEIGKSFSSFLHKLRTDPMTRVLFVMYLNIVVVIVVFLSLIAKHVQISLQQMRMSHKKPELPTASPVAAAATKRAIGSPALTIEAPRRCSPLSNATSLKAIDTDVTNEDNKTIDWSAVVNPSLLNYVNEETMVSAVPKQRLLNDLEGLLSESSTQPSDSLESNDEDKPVTPFPSLLSTSERSPEPGPATIQNTKYYSALESSLSNTFDASTSQCLPSPKDDVWKL